MKVLIVFGLALVSAISFAQTSNDKLLKTCVNNVEGIELFVFQRLDFAGRPIQSRVKKQNLFRVEIYENNIPVYENNTAISIERNFEFYTARGMALTLNESNSGRLYVSLKDRYGRPIGGPEVNAIKVNCRNF